MGDIFRHLELLYDRPDEPLISPKGENDSVFQLTSEYLPPGYESNGIELNNRFGEDASEIIPLTELTVKPQFTEATKLPRDADFSLLFPAHQVMANEVIDVLMGVPENQLQDFLSTCAFTRAKLNPQLFNYCFSVALLHRKDTKKAKVQNFAETFPAKFMTSQVFRDAREAAAVIPKTVPRPPIIIPRDYTATDLEDEHRLAYWREDLGINLHHWHWHLVYPFTASDIKIVAKDRRGELFFYMHQQIIARYNSERLCNNLKRVLQFNNWREPIVEAYYPKLDSLTSARGWVPRQSGMTWQDLNRPAEGLRVTINDMEKWRRNVENAIASGSYQLPNGELKELDIDTLGNIMEASILSPNPELYGSIHNNGHNFGGYMHDPEHKYLENFAVMSDEATNMRDPFFYRWHAWVDDLFQSYKQSDYVRSYTSGQLGNPGVEVTSVAVETSGAERNTLNTFWMSSDVDMSKGLDFSDRGPVYVRFTHLNHRPFKYVINVNNTGSARMTTVRIFIAPELDERGLEWIFNDHRKMFIEMDRFVTTLKAGANTITRQSTESTLTIPFEQTFRNLNVPEGATSEQIEAFNYCGCGWPQHMLVPKGTEPGARYLLFVMLSNYEMDKVDQPDKKELTCVEASMFCGLKDRKYPDRRPMGFPFDRPSRTASSIQDFIADNMALQKITIRLQNVTEDNPRNPRIS